MKIVSLFTKALHSAQGRIVAGIGMVAALVNGLSPDQSRQFDAGKAATVLVAVVVWLYSELAGASQPSNVDVELYRRIKELMNDEALTFLKDHDFGGSLHDSKTSPVGEICSWHGANNEFRDSKIQKAWQACQTRINILGRHYAHHLGPMHRSDRLSAIPPGTDDWDTPEHLRKAIVELNQSASDSYQAFNDFDRIARNRLNL
jgi:hypothetical protein